MTNAFMEGCCDYATWYLCGKFLVRFSFALLIALLIMAIMAIIIYLVREGK